jgi:hypothetical protein
MVVKMVVKPSDEAAEAAPGLPETASDLLFLLSG